MNTKVDEGKLISGKEALIAIGEGEEIEYKFKDSNGWMPQNCLTIDGYLSDVAIFRLKPRTITINSIEVPSVRYIAHSGGNCVKISCHCPEDARVVNAALRQVFGGSHDN